MKPNLYSGFKKTAEDEKSATLTHENGHVIRLAKNGLPPEHKKALSALPLYQDDPQGVIPDPTADIPNASDASTGEPIAAAPIAPGNAKPDTYATLPGSPADVIGESLKRAFSDQGKNVPFHQIMADVAAEKNPAQAASPSSISPAPAPAPQQPAPGIQPPQNAQPPLDATQQNPNAAYANLPGYAQETGANTAIGKAQQQQFTSEAQDYAHHQEIENYYADQQRQALQHKMDEINNVSQDYAEGKIQPKHMFDDTTAPQRILKSIGLILGGIGGGLTGQENPVLKMASREIEQDLDAQKANMGKKANLLNALQNQYNDINVASNMFRATRANVFANQLNQEAAKSQSAQAMPLAQKANAELMAKYYPMVQSANALDLANRLQRNNQPGQQPSVQQAALISRGLINPSMGASPAETEAADKELNGVEQTLKKHQAADMLIDKISKLQTLGQRFASPVQSGQQIAAAKAEFYPLIQSEDPSKRLTPEQMDKELNPLIPGLTSSKGTVDSMRTGVHRLIDTNAPGTATLEKYRVPVPKYQAPAEIQNFGGVPYRKVPGGWKKAS